MSRPPFAQRSESSHDVAVRNGDVDSTGTYSAGIENFGPYERIVSLKDWQQDGVLIESIEAMAYRSETTSVGSDPTGEAFDVTGVEYRLIVGEEDNNGDVTDPRLEKLWNVSQLPADFSQPVEVRSNETVEIHARWFDAGAANGDPMQAHATMTYRTEQ